MLICTIAILFLATTSTTIPIVSGSYDKANHIFAFLTLSFLTDMSVGKIKKRIVLITGVLLLYGLIIELIQWQLPHRFFSIADIAADALAILSYWFMKILATTLINRRERKNR